MAEHRRAKSVCTLGPATFSSGKIVQLIKAGMDVVRLNFSHGTVQQHARTVRTVRKAASNLGKPVAILLDLPGPKIRVGEVAGGEVELKGGRQIVLTGRRVVGTDKRISSTYPNLAKDVRPGDRILIDDGRIHLRVFQVDGLKRFLDILGLNSNFDIFQFFFSFFRPGRKDLAVIDPGLDADLSHDGVRLGQ